MYQVKAPILTSLTTDTAPSAAVVTFENKALDTLFWSQDSWRPLKKRRLQTNNISELTYPKMESLAQFPMQF